MACTWPGQRRTAASRRTVESAPPLKATARGRGSSRPARAAAAGLPAGSGGFGLGVGEAAIALQPLVAPLQQLADLQVAELAPGVVQCALEEGGHLLVVAVRATHRLVDDLVDQAQRLEAVRRDAHGIGRVLRLVAGLPQDRCAALG